MSKATGVDGDLSFISGHNACFDMFENTRTQRLIDTSCFGETDEDFTGGQQGGRFMAEGTIIYNDTNTKPGMDDITATGGSVTFTYASGCTQTATCVIEEATTRVVKQGESRVRFSGRHKGALVETWDESSS